MNRALDLLKRNTTFVLKPLILVLVPLKEHHSECRYIVYGRGGVSNICRSSSQRPRRRSGRSPDRWRVRACGEYSRTPHCLTEVASVCLIMKAFSLFETPRLCFSVQNAQIVRRARKSNLPSEMFCAVKAGHHPQGRQP